MTISDPELLVSQLSQDYAESVQQTVTFSFGQLELHKLRAPPAVMWLPTGGTVHDATAYPGDPLLVGMAMAAEHTFDVHCWATTRDDAIRLWRNVLRLVWRLGRTASKLGTFSVLTEQEATAAFSVKGAVVIQKLTLILPVPRDYEQLVGAAAGPAEVYTVSVPLQPPDDAGEFDLVPSLP